MPRSDMLCSSILLVVATLFTLPTGGVAAGSSGGFLRTPQGRSIESLINEALRATSIGNSTLSQRFRRVEQSLQPTHQALPKNGAGRLAPKAVHYAVRNYFAKEHGWSVKGLDQPVRSQIELDGIQDVSILQDKVPSIVEGLLDARHNGHGLSFHELVAMVCVLEQVIVDEAVRLLEAAYMLNGISGAHMIQEEDLHEIMLTYLLLFRRQQRELPAPEAHLKQKQLLQRAGGPVWTASQAFEHDMVLNFAYMHRHQLNAFKTARYSFDMAYDIVNELAEGYGKWQHSECLDMKDHLLELDVTHTGRVPLSTFHAQPRTPKYSFSEPAETLREYGALDESDPAHPQVIIANYIVNPSNCIAEGTYFSVCCVSECEALLDEIAGHVQAPTAPADVLVGLVSNLTTSSMDAPKELSQDLLDKLHEIERLNGGSVPLHGRLFAQWLHFAFPAECPYPRSAVKAEETNGSAQWSDEEVLPLLEETGYRRWAGVDGRAGSIMGTVLRLVVGCVALFVACQGAASSWNTAVHTLSDGKTKRGLAWNSYQANGAERHAEACDHSKLV